MIKYTIQEIIDWAPSFSLLEVVIQKKCFFCFIWVLKVSLRLTLIQKRGLCPLRLLPLMIEFSVCAPSGYNSRERMAGGRFFEGLQSYILNKNKGNENKIIIGELNCTVDKIDRDGENKTQRLFRWCSNYALWKLITNNALEGLWRRENPDLPKFTCYNRSFAKDPYLTDVKIANNTKINHIRVSFTDHYNVISIGRLPVKNKIGKDLWYFNNSVLWNSEISSATKAFFFY